jgi:integrase/recombinase XerD
MGDLELPLEAEEFLVWLTSERGRARNTIQAYRRDLTAYQSWLEQRGTTMLAVTTHDLVDLVGELRASGAATTSVARRLAAIRMLHRYLAIEQVRPDDPTGRLDGVRVPSGIPKPLTEARSRA